MDVDSCIIYRNVDMQIFLNLEAIFLFSLDAVQKQFLKPLANKKWTCCTTCESLMWIVLECSGGVEDGDVGGWQWFYAVR